MLFQKFEDFRKTERPSALDRDSKIVRIFIWPWKLHACMHLINWALFCHCGHWYYIKANSGEISQAIPPHIIH